MREAKNQRSHSVRFHSLGGQKVCWGFSVRSYGKKPNGFFFFLSNLIFEIIGTDKSIEAENRRVVATSQGRREKGGDC